MDIDREITPNSTNALPLFRPEAVAAQQMRGYGVAVRLRPFSWVEIMAIAVLIVAITLGGLLLSTHAK